MVILEFTESVLIEGSDRTVLRKIYFVGQSIGDVLADTEDGTKFALPAKWSPPREINVDEARLLNLDSLEYGILSVTRGITKSFYLGAIKQNLDEPSKRIN